MPVSGFRTVGQKCALRVQIADEVTPLARARPGVARSRISGAYWTPMPGRSGRRGADRLFCATPGSGGRQSNRVTRPARIQRLRLVPEVVASFLDRGPPASTNTANCVGFRTFSFRRTPFWAYNGSQDGGIDLAVENILSRLVGEAGDEVADGIEELWRHISSREQYKTSPSGKASSVENKKASQSILSSSTSLSVSYLNYRNLSKTW